uniref:Uncharacterized protein n=1 Tax=candidate division WWE3 bacterium TaxID=2053526 RepID=A0A7C4TPW7_UNCKA
MRAISDRFLPSISMSGQEWAVLIVVIVLVVWCVAMIWALGVTRSVPLGGNFGSRWLLETLGWATKVKILEGGRPVIWIRRYLWRWRRVEVVIARGAGVGATYWYIDFPSMSVFEFLLGQKGNARSAIRDIFDNLGTVSTEYNKLTAIQVFTRDPEFQRVVSGPWGLPPDLQEALGSN